MRNGSDGEHERNDGGEHEHGSYDDEHGDADDSNGGRMRNEAEKATKRARHSLGSLSSSSSSSSSSAAPVAVAGFHESDESDKSIPYVNTVDLMDETDPECLQWFFKLAKKYEDERARELADAVGGAVTKAMVPVVQAMAGIAGEFPSTTAAAAATPVAFAHGAGEGRRHRFCHSCGGSLQPGARFCSECGERVPNCGAQRENERRPGG